MTKFNGAIMSTGCQMVAFVLSALAVNTIAQADSFPIMNDTDVPLRVWCWDNDDKNWVSPPLSLAAHQRGTLQFVNGRRYYVVAKSAQDGQILDVLGWMDLDRLRLRSSQAELVLRGGFRIENVRREFIVYRHVQETVTTTQQIQEWTNTDGQWRLSTRNIEVPRTVSRSVAETVQRDVPTTVLRLDAVPSAHGQFLSSQVTFQTEQPGAYIKYRLLGRSQTSITATPTDSTEKIPVGFYEYWTVRDGKATSYRHTRDIYDEQILIKVPERTAQSHE